MTKRGDHMLVDWTGTDPQVKGAINNTYSYTKAASYTAIRSVLPANIPNNEGVFRAIEVIAPPGTIANGVLPAACAARGLTGFRMVDCAFGCLAMMLPGQGLRRFGRRQHRHHHRRLVSPTARPSSMSTSPAGPGAPGRGPTAWTATPTCSPTWPRTRSR